MVKEILIVFSLYIAINGIHSHTLSSGLIIAGVTSNAVAVGVNGFEMPSIFYDGQWDYKQLNSNTNLPFLCDEYYFGIDYRPIVVFSLGDVLILGGLFERWLGN